MKTIVCYGDSNTYGFNPVTGFRYPKHIRWTGRLQELLGEDYLVIEEGCNGRTTVFEDPVDGWKKGQGFVKPCLNTHKPVDIVILMLGTNDLKNMFHASAEIIAKGTGQLVQEIYEFSDAKLAMRPEVILVSPPVVGDGICSSSFHYAFDETAITRSRQFAKYYQEVANRMDCIFFNAAKYVKSSEADSIHLMPEAHASLAKGLSSLVSSKLSKRCIVKSKRLIMNPYPLDEMKSLQENETNEELKTAYGEMITCMKQNPEKEFWGAAWNIALHDGTRVGDLCFKGAPDETGTVEIGYGIDKEFEGNGYATEMVAAMVHWATIQPGVKRLVAETAPDNIASQKVLEKNGFTQEGQGEEGPSFVFHTISYF